MEHQGVTYHDWTSTDVAIVIGSLIHNDARVRIHYGDRVTGVDWMDSFDVYGTVGLSMGPRKIPLLIHNSRSTGGSGIMTECIVRITTTAKGQGTKRNPHPDKVDLYRHPNYHLDLVKANEWLTEQGVPAFLRHFGPKELAITELHATLTRMNATLRP